MFRCASTLLHNLQPPLARSSVVFERSRQEQDYEFVPQRTSVGTPFRASDPQAVVAVHLTDTEWYPAILRYLEEHPEASLVSVVLHLWPGFLGLPAARRAQTWFWLKDELQRLCAKGILQQQMHDAGVTTWSIARKPF